ncbi:MAG: hypothetical protein ACERLG_06340 [Sedimentibacter sp.]
MYNFALAFTVCCAAFAIGEVVSIKTKAWVPGIFITAAVMLIGYWTILPHELISDSFLIPFGSTIGIYLLIVHMGTVISLKQLIEQWKTIVICLSGLAGMVTISYFLCPLFMPKVLVVAGLPPLTGGIVAATIMQKAAADAGLITASVFAITMYCIQGFAGYPITAVCLQKEGKRLLKKLRSGEDSITEEERRSLVRVSAVANVDPNEKKLLPQIPEKYNSSVVVLGKLGLVGWFASMLGSMTGVSGAIWALLLGVFFTTIGFLDRSALNKANSYGIVMFALMMYVFDGLKNCTIEMLQSIVGPMIILIVVGVVGMGIFSFIASKILKVSFPLAFANSLTALYGFPCDAIITEATCTSLGETDEEIDYLMSKMFPSMIVGGFTSVTITSVFVASAFALMIPQFL